MMKKSLCLIISAIMLFTLASCSNSGYEYDTVEKSGEISVVSFNCDAPEGSTDTANSPGKRVKLFASYMNSVKPDIIGVQEISVSWMKKLEKLMPDYGTYGVERGGDKNDTTKEMNTIFWLKERYTLLFEDTFWLAESVGSESAYPGASANRTCGFTVLRDNVSGKTVIVMNTQLDDESKEAREFGANLIKLRLNILQENYEGSEVIIIGDLNDTADGKAYSMFSESFTSCDTATESGIGVTYHKWGEITDGEPTDFIFTSCSPVTCYRLDNNAYGYVSDHYGVYAEINY